MEDILELSLIKIVEHSDALLNEFCLFSIEDSELDGIISQTKTRDKLLKQLFTQNSKSELARFPDLLNKIAALDSELVKHAEQLKATLAKKVIKQKKNNKATSAYRSSTK